MKDFTQSLGAISPMDSITQARSDLITVSQYYICEHKLKSEPMH